MGGERSCLRYCRPHTEVLDGIPQAGVVEVVHHVHHLVLGLALVEQ